MDIQDNSIVGTIIDYANVKFGVELTKEQVSDQLKTTGFSDMLKLVSAIKNEDDDAFLDYIDLSTVNETGYGSSGSYGPSSATIRKDATVAAQTARRDKNLTIKSATRENPAKSGVAGSNIKPTGTTAAPVSTQPNVDQVDTNTEISSDNSAEIERLKQLINKGKA